MDAVLGWTIVTGTLLVAVVAVYQLLRDRRRRRTGRKLAATYVDEVTAFFYGTKRMELDHRESMSMMRDEEAQGAPPVDLDRGVINLRRPS